MNPIQKMLQSRVDSLISNAEGIAALEHSATVGTLREKLLIDFFSDLIPMYFSITSGIVCDASNNVSRQLDFIVKNDFTLPSMVMKESISIVPVEAVHLIAEIKSTLKTEHLTKIANDYKYFYKLKLACYPASQNAQIKIPAIVLAYSSEAAKDTLKDWMSKTANVVSVCIVGKYSLSKEKDGIALHESSSGYPKHWETLVFTSQLFSFLNESRAVHRGNPLLSAYLSGVKND